MWKLEGEGGAGRRGGRGREESILISGFAGKRIFSLPLLRVHPRGKNGGEGERANSLSFGLNS